MSFSLSPYVLSSARALMMGCDADLLSKPSIDTVVMYRCPSCSELHEWETEAKLCCTGDHEREGIYCPVCGDGASTYRDAADCCLWHDIDAYTRWKMADAVEAGSDWATELRLKP